MAQFGRTLTLLTLFCSFSDTFGIGVECSASEFTCLDRAQCIPSSRKCDGGTPDCADGSDESHGLCTQLKTLDDILAETKSMKSNVDENMDKLIHKVEEFRDNLNHPVTSTPPPTPFPQKSVVCKNYTELSESWRKIDYVNRDEFLAQCDTSGVYYGTPSKYSNLTVAWYRFTGAAGTKLPTGPAPVGGGPSYGSYDQICATGGVAYIKSGGHPTLQEGIVTRDVCFEFGWNKCERTTTLRVAACSDTHGEYFVYELQPVPRCDNAYCAIE